MVAPGAPSRGHERQQKDVEDRDMILDPIPSSNDFHTDPEVRERGVWLL